MNTYSFRKDLLAVQEELLRFAYKLTADREEANDLLQETSLKALDNEDKFEPDTNFRGWMYTIMRNIFINNYRKIVREQTFVDQTDNQYHLSMPQDSGFASTEGSTQFILSYGLSAQNGTASAKAFLTYKDQKGKVQTVYSDVMNHTYA